MKVLPPRPRLTSRPSLGGPLPPQEVAELEDWEPELFRGRPLTVLLTRMERNVLESLCEGKSNRMIARDWGLSEDTIKSHVKNLMAKIGAQDRTHAVSLVWSGVVLVKVGTVTVAKRTRRRTQGENEPVLAA